MSWTVDPTTVSGPALLDYARSVAPDLRVQHVLDDKGQRRSACLFSGPDDQPVEVVAEPGADIAIVAYRAVCAAFGIRTERAPQQERSEVVQAIVDATLAGDKDEAKFLARSYARGNATSARGRAIRGRFNIR